MSEFKPTEYLLECVATGRRFDDTGWLLEDNACGEPSLIRTVYAKKQIDFGPATAGIYRFADWLPVNRTLEGSASPVTFRSRGLSEKLGIPELYITFSGYDPDRGAAMTTCSFKETEAYSVCGRFDPSNGKVLVVASAGNTARAFARVCSDNRIPLLLFVPEDNLGALWFETPLDECVKLIAAVKGSDYFDAIHLSNIALKSERFIAEGGAKNVARRDGMATTVLSAAEHIGRIPDYYFQAVGSGTGAIAAWEANMRLLGDGRFGEAKMKIIVSQNAPFLPMYYAWQDRSRELPPYTDTQARADTEQIAAKVLSNRKPPYGIAGGLYDALADTDGDVIAVTNDEAARAGELFERLEGIDIHPAAAVAVASLIKAEAAGDVDRAKTVMLNITGGGEKRFREGRSIWNLTPSIVLRPDQDEASVIQAAEKLFA